jgi:Flavodoxin
MRVVVIYESMFGNTHVIAEAVAAGLQQGNEVTVVPVAQAARELLAGAGLVVVGGPTHVHGMSRANTRKGAVQMASKPGSKLALDANAEGPGLRDWFASLGQISVPAAAFDTRLEGRAVFTGRASRAIRRELGRHGFSVIAPPKSFLVTGNNQLRPGEEDRARGWGEQLAGKLAVARAPAVERT